MAGLFDTLFNADPNNQASLALASGLLSGRGNFNGVLGQALMGGQGAYNEAGSLQNKARLTEAQIQDQLAQAAQRQQMIDLERAKLQMATNFGNPPQGQQSQAAPAPTLPSLGGMNFSQASAAANGQPVQAQAPAPYSPFTQPGALNKVAGLKLAGFGDLTDLYKLANGGMPIPEGWNYNPITGTRQFNPKVVTSADGKTVVLSAGPDGTYNVSAPNGAVKTFSDYQKADAYIKALTTPTEYYANGAPRKTSVANLLGLGTDFGLGGSNVSQPGVVPAGSGGVSGGAPGVRSSGAPGGVQAGPSQVESATGSALTGFAEDIKKQVADSFAQATAAKNSLQIIGRMRDAVASGNINVGQGATFKQFGGQIAQGLGINGKTEEDRLANTRNLIQNAAQLSLTTARELYKGQGTVSIYERQAIEKAAAGNIDSMTMPELRALMTGLETAKRYQIEQHIELLGRVPEQLNQGGFSSFYRVPMPGQIPAIPEGTTPTTQGGNRFEQQRIRRDWNSQ